MNKVAASFLLLIVSMFPIAALSDIVEVNIVGPVIEFGPVSVGSSAQTVIGGTNNTPYVLSVYAALGGPDAGDFSIINKCSGVPIVPGVSCSGAIGFAPHGVGPKNAELIIILRGIPDVALPPPDVVVSKNTENNSIQEVAPVQFLHIETRALSGTGK